MGTWLARTASPQQTGLESSLFLALEVSWLRTLRPFIDAFTVVALSCVDHITCVKYQRCRHKKEATFFFLSRRNFGAIDLFSYPLDKVALLPAGVTLKSHSGAISLPILAMWPTVREMMLFWQMGNHTDHDGYRCFFSILLGRSKGRNGKK